MLSLASRNLFRRPLRTGLTVFGMAMAVAVLACLLSFGEGYQKGLHKELDGMGMQMMLVPLGCPYDAAARMLKGKALDVTLPSSALTTARSDRAVSLASPVYTAVVPRPTENRTDLWVGVDETVRDVKPWWKVAAGSEWFQGPDSVILGAEAATLEMRKPGDRLFSPETGREFRVAAVLQRSGTSDDSLFFVPLKTAQSMFHQPDRLTAIAIRLRDSAMSPEAVEQTTARLQKIKGSQVVTLSEMMGSFLRLLGSARTLVMAITVVAVVIGGLSVLNTMMASVLERTSEIGVMRAVGFPRSSAFLLMSVEAVALSVMGGVAGLLLALLIGRGVERMVLPFLPLAPEGGLPSLTASAAVTALALMGLLGIVAGIFPAWRASRLSPVQALREH